MTRLFVGNIDYAVTEAELAELFSQCGRVTTVRIPLDRESGRPRGFAFVDFDVHENAMAAIERLNDTNFGGRRMSVSEAVDRARPPLTQAGAPQAPRPTGAPERRFGPDAAPASKRRSPHTQPKGPRGPIKERRGGGSAGGDDGAPDELPFWAQNDDEQT